MVSCFKHISRFTSLEMWVSHLTVGCHQPNTWDHYRFPKASSGTITWFYHLKISSSNTSTLDRFLIPIPSGNLVLKHSWLGKETSRIKDSSWESKKIKYKGIFHSLYFPTFPSGKFIYYKHPKNGRFSSHNDQVRQHLRGTHSAKLVKEKYSTSGGRRAMSTTASSWECQRVSGRRRRWSWGSAISNPNHSEPLPQCLGQLPYGKSRCKR